MNFFNVRNLDQLLFKTASLELDEILEILSACQNPHHVITYQWFRELLERMLGYEDINIKEFFKIADDKLKSFPMETKNLLMDIKTKVLHDAPAEHVNEDNQYGLADSGSLLHVDRFDGGGSSGTGSGLLGRT